MNKIIVTDKEINCNLDDSIKYKILSSDNDMIKTISLDIFNDTNLEMEYNIDEEIKVDFNINIDDNVSVDIIDKKIGNNIKSKYHYILGENSHLVLNKINDGKYIREYDIGDLNGENSSFLYVLKTISKTKEVYDILINHNSSYTSSDVYTSGVNIEEGIVTFNVTGYVPKGKIECNVNQNNRIINLTNNQCEISPNLLIDEMRVVANHSAHISNLSDDDLFYLGLRGINREDATKLLLKSLLSTNVLDTSKEYIIKLLDKYWR